MNPYKPYIKRYRLSFLASTFFLAMEAICDIAQPTLLAYLVDKGVRTGDLSIIVYYGSFMLIVTVVGALNALMRNYISAQVAYKFGKDLRRDLFEKVVSMSPTVGLRFDQGSLMTRLTHDVNQIQNFTTGLMRIFLKAPLLGLGSMWMVYRLNRELFNVFLVLLPVMSLLILLNLKIGYPLYIKVQKSLDGLNERMREFFNGIRVIRAFNRFDFEKEKFSRVNDESSRSLSTALRQLAIFGPAMSLVVQLSIVYVLYMSHTWIKVGNIGLGILMAFIQYMLQFLFALMIITRVFNLFVRAKSSAARIGELLGLPADEQVDEKAPDAPHDVLGAITFNNVSFSYLEGEPVLKKIHFTIEKNQRIGIIGSTGSGKSTLVEILMGFYPPDQGQILINDQPYSIPMLKQARNQMGYVPQKSILFSGSIAENLKWGSEAATAEDLEWAVHIAQISDFIKDSPLGFQTVIGRGGVNVSGGQKQRLAIARALLVKPQILILDDSTSALDSLTEYEFRKALQHGLGPVTTIIVSQRISSIMDSDRILVLSEGEIKGYDTHEVLLRTSDIYRELYETQLGSEVEK